MWAHACGSDIKHAAICKHFPTCTQLIKQPHRLLFPVICSDINATGRSSIYWIDSPAAARVGSGRRAQPAVYPILGSRHEMFLFHSFQTQIYDALAADRSERRSLNVSWRGREVSPLSRITHSGEREVVSVSGEDIVQSSEGSILKMVCLKLSSPQTNAGLNHFLQSPGLSLNKRCVDCEHKSKKKVFYSGNQWSKSFHCRGLKV